MVAIRKPESDLRLCEDRNIGMNPQYAQTRFRGQILKRHAIN